MEVYVGLDLSRKRLDWQAVDGQRQPLAEGARPWSWAVRGSTRRSCWSAARGW